MSRRSLHSRFVALALVVGLLVASTLFVWGPAGSEAAAQDTPVSAEFDAAETEATIDRVRTMLFVIAAVTGGLLVVYIWHTNPRRRMAAAVRRRDARELAALDSLGDAFVLPGELDDLEGEPAAVDQPD